jgi:Xanthine and CO dehydrogenases maturation factor, XdhC/CoxF family
MEYFKKVSEWNKEEKVTSITILTGVNAGEKALWSSKGFVYKTCELSLWVSLQKELEKNLQDNYIEIEGVRFFCEILEGQNNLIICGAGHISMPLISMGKMLGFGVTVVDDRIKFANNARAMKADKVICDNFITALDCILDSQNNYFVIVTRGHQHDRDCLINILKRPSAYVGMIGSRRRVKTVKDSVLEEGIEKEVVEKIYSPIGLDIGAETPEEIGVAIMAEIIQVKNKEKGKGGFTKELLNTILEGEKEAAPKMALLTIVKRRGSAPRGVGTKMLVLEDGSFHGTIGGGCAEAEAFHQALSCMKESKCMLTEVDMTGNSYEEEGMVCGGIIEIFIESIGKIL